MNNGRQTGVDVSETVAVVSPYAGKHVGSTHRSQPVRESGEQDVQPPVIIGITPCDRGVKNPWQPCIDIYETSVCVLPHLSGRRGRGIRQPCEQDVESSVIVVVAPGCGG